MNLLLACPPQDKGNEDSLDSCLVDRALREAVHWWVWFMWNDGIGLIENAGTLQIHLLGGFYVAVGQRVIENSEWHLRKAQSLLKLLALEPSHRLHRAQVIDLLWGDKEVEAKNSLHRIVHAIRHTLEPTLAPGASSAYLHIQGESLVLRPPDGLWIDIEVFEEYCNRARWSQDTATTEEALLLYQGDLLPDDTYEEWTASRRDQLRQLYSTTRLDLARLYTQQGNLSQAIQHLEDLTRYDPTFEDAQRELMRLYAATAREYMAVRRYQHLKQTLMDELGVLPSAETEQLFQTILADCLPQEERLLRSPGIDDPTPNAPRRRRLPPLIGERSMPLITSQPIFLSGNRHTNLPEMNTPFIGRHEELAKIKRFLEKTRLLTLTGVGGCGKTRLAQQAGAAALTTYQDGVWLVDLTAITDARLLPGSILTALAMSEEADRSPTETLAHTLEAKHLLLILDNCEHLLPACRQFVQGLLKACPKLSILATSRQRLKIEGETSWPVPSMITPDPEHLPAFNRLLVYDAIRFFVEWAKTYRSGFDLTPQNALSIVQLCTQLDGIPLAIELAASLIRVATTQQILSRLDDRLALLRGRLQEPPTRHQTLRAAIDWSYDLLTTQEQQLFQRLSVFAGGWTLEASEHICAGEGVSASDILYLLAQLEEKSLLLVEQQSDQIRYRLPETLRQYSAEKLRETGQADHLRLRHLNWYLALVEAAEAQLATSEQKDWLERLERERHNIQAALHWAQRSGELEAAFRMGGALWQFWYHAGHIREGYHQCQELVSLVNAHQTHIAASVRAKALYGAGVIAWAYGNYDRAEQIGEQSLALYRGLNDLANSAQALYIMGLAARDAGHWAQAEDFSRESFECFQAAKDTRGMALALHNLGNTLRDQGCYEQATTLYTQSLELAQAGGFQQEAAIAQYYLGVTACLQGHARLAAERLILSLQGFRGLGLLWGIAQCIEGLAAAALMQGATPLSARLFGAGEVLREGTSSPMAAAGMRTNTFLVALAQKHAEEPAWHTELARGRTQPLEASLDEARSVASLAGSLHSRPKSKTVRRHRPVLSHREQHIVDFIAAGQTNSQIAQSLAIAKRTVDTHVSRILKKLQVHSRTEIASWVQAQKRSRHPILEHAASTTHEAC